MAACSVEMLKLATAFAAMVCGSIVLPVVTAHADWREAEYSHIFAEPSAPVLGGTYAGNIFAWRDRGNGTYFHIVNDDPARMALPVANAGPRIIGRDEIGDGCSFEAGVCVVRP